jgi:2-methylcitrate dehydratase PrpD
VKAAFALRTQIGTENVECVLIGANPSAQKLCYPLEVRRRPRTLQDAKYSIPFMTAFALVHGTVTLDNLHDGALEDPLVLALARCIEVIESVEDNPGMPPAEMRILSNGTTRVVHETAALHVSPQDARTKFKSCLAYADLSQQADIYWERLMQLEPLSCPAILCGPVLSA